MHYCDGAQLSGLSETHGSLQVSAACPWLQACESGSRPSAHPVPRLRDRTPLNWHTAGEGMEFAGEWWDVQSSSVRTPGLPFSLTESRRPQACFCHGPATGACTEVVCFLPPFGGVLSTFHDPLSVLDSESEFHFLVGKTRVSGHRGPGKGEATTGCS